MPVILDGRLAAEALRLKMLSSYQEAIVKDPPGLAVVVVGDDPRSKSYVSNKLRSAEKWGIRCRHINLSRSSTSKDIESHIARLNEDPAVHGIILQLPPDTETPIAAREIHRLLEFISPAKDADGLLSASLGELMCKGEDACPVPATPLGILRLLEHYQIPVEGRDVCVIGKSRLVGLPLAVLLEHKGATVTLCHSLSKNIEKKAKSSDIVVGATGHLGLIQNSFVHEKSVVIDVGIVLTPVGLRGDADHEIYERVAAYSPVPGGVGPMTVAALMENVLRLWQAPRLRR